MAWASKKQYAILMSSEEGKDLAEQLGEMEQDEFNKKFSELLGKSGQSASKSKKEDNQKAKQKWLDENGYESEDDVDWWERDDNADEYPESQKRKIDTLDKELNIEEEVKKMMREGKTDLEIKNYLDDTTEDFDWFGADEYLNEFRNQINDEEDEEDKNEILEHFKKAGIDIVDTMPEGWREIKGATTAPLGYMWINNNKSRFSGERKHALLKMK